MKKRAQQLRQYFSDLQTVREKVQALVRIKYMTLQYENPLDPDEEEEFSKIENELLSPMKEENGETVLDVDAFRETVAVMKEMQMDCEKSYLNAARHFYIEALEE